LQTSYLFCSSLKKELDKNVSVISLHASTKSEGVKMLDAYIIEQIRKREEERRRNERPVLELPLPVEDPIRRRRKEEEEETEREPSRVIVIDL
jgi:hypothetical protein